ncbi:MAG: hypothetical protein LBC63_03175 [Holophagales bacterium]|jgi:predicted HicB family RNase H-like nuclease|nr:hypothetical protein [Holophagales bacterium]
MSEQTAAKQETLTYKGYTAVVAWDEDECRYWGNMVGQRNIGIEVMGATLEEAQAEFADSVEWYLEGCAEDGIEPEKPHVASLPKPSE